MRVVYAKTGVHLATPWGGTIWVGPGTHWDADDPLVREHAELFSDDPATGLTRSQPEPTPGSRVIIGPDAEQLTAAPGERRIRPNAERVRG